MTPARLWTLTEAYIVLHGRSGAHVSPHTIENYERGTRKLLEHWQGENLLRPSGDAPLRFVRELEEEGLAPGSINVRLASARTLHKALRWAGATEAAPFADVKAPRDPTPAEEKRQAYSDEAIEELVKYASTPDRVLILLAAHGGLRISEILALKWTDVDLAGGTLKVSRGKGGKRRTVHLSAALAAVLEQYQAWSPTDTVYGHMFDEYRSAEAVNLSDLLGSKTPPTHQN